MDERGESLDRPEDRRPVAAGSGWPGDPAEVHTPVAHAADDVERLAASAADMADLDARTSVCRACPRLVAWREEVAGMRRAAFAEERYWGRPVPSFGPADARVLIVGLAPAAHGGNRTGRIFTGDRSGDWLFASLHRVGLAELPISVSAADGQRLFRTRIAAVVRCAPPANKPTTAERDTCRSWLVRDLELLRPTLRAVVVLGGFAWTALWPALARAGYPAPPARPAFAHARRVVLAEGQARGLQAVDCVPVPPPAGASRYEHVGAGRADVEGSHGLVVLGCYHPSQQNTFTGRVTAEMLDAVLGYAAGVAGAGVMNR